MLLARQDHRIRGIAPLNTFATGGLRHSGDRRADPDLSPRTPTPRSAGAGRLVRAGDHAWGVTTMDHIVLLNRGSRFEAVPLPREAQFAPAFHAGIADFDGDGNEDVFLSQNFFATEISVPRYDAGREPAAPGDGRGGLTPVPGQRPACWSTASSAAPRYADFNGDGRLDLVVSQNGAATKPVREPRRHARASGCAWWGRPGNPDGIGAQLRIVYGGPEGPVREVQAGSGYWSQNGAVQVFGLSATPVAVRARWPGGGETRVVVPAGAREVVVRR